ncbi:MAG: hypothetical protein ACE145_15770 [Terriglobia bacterium]
MAPPPQFRRRISILASVSVLVGAFPSPASAQQEAITKLQDTLARTGIFFRADAPYILRNREDTNLPIYLESINGVERTGRSAVGKIAPYVKREPLRLEGVNVFAKPAGARRQFTEQPVLLGESEEFSFDARVKEKPYIVDERLKKTLEIPLATLGAYLGRHYLGGPFETVDLRVSFRVAGWPSQDTCLRVRLNGSPLPRLESWYRGDMHYHSSYTDNPAERGYPLSITKQAALQTGLDWVVLADHSTELDPARYESAAQEVAKYQDGRFLFIRGEELTVSSAKQAMLTTLHLVALPSPEDPARGFPSPAAPADAVIMTGDGSIASPAMPLREALDRVAAAGGFAYAAHPFDPVSPVLRGGSWDLELDFLGADGKHLAPGLVGLEPWNRATQVTADYARDPYCIRRDADPASCFQPDKEADQYARLERGIELAWKPLLQRGLSADAGSFPAFKVFLAAGSDAHGDLNYEATMDAVDFLSKPSRGVTGYAEDNAFGKLSTVAHCPRGMGRRGEQVLGALRSGKTILSNGPLLIGGFDLNSNGSLDDPQDVVSGGEIAAMRDQLAPLRLQWVSSDEFGPFVSIRLFVGSAGGESGPEEIPIPPGMTIASRGLSAFDLGPRLGKLSKDGAYIRLEARTRNNAGEEFRCYTNPVWIRLTE